MKTVETNWSQFKLRVNAKTSVEKAYQAWATPTGLESWFLRNATFKDVNGKIREKNSLIQKGDAYVWTWHGYSDQVIEKGTILEANGNDKFAFTFSLQCPVTINIYMEVGETIVELLESNLPTDEKTIVRHHMGDSRGWVFYLTNLKSVLEGGIDLRNRREELTNVITA
jgi:hypothetical protein